VKVVILIQRILEEWSDWWDVISAMGSENDVTLVFFGDAALSLYSKKPSCRFYVYSNENVVFSEWRIGRGPLSILLRDAEKVLTV
jgi:hypothetical protein